VNDCGSAATNSRGRGNNGRSNSGNRAVKASKRQFVHVHDVSDVNRPVAEQSHHSSSSLLPVTVQTQREEVHEGEGDAFSQSDLHALAAVFTLHTNSNDLSTVNVNVTVYWSYYCPSTFTMEISCQTLLRN
jgi:hypothetical protein